MADIVDKQYEFLDKIDILIASGTLDTTYITADNMVDDSASLPVIVLDLQTTGTENLGSGGTGLVDFNMMLIIVQSVTKATSFKLAQAFTIDALETILAQIDIQANYGTIEHKKMIINNKNCSWCEVPVQLY